MKKQNPIWRLFITTGDPKAYVLYKQMIRDSHMRRRHEDME